jgi:hypothetical protein
MHLWKDRIRELITRFYQDSKAILSQALRFHALAPNMIVKIPVTFRLPWSARNSTGSHASKSRPELARKPGPRRPSPLWNLHLRRGIVVLRFHSGAIATIDNSRKAVYGYDQCMEILGSLGKTDTGNR